MLARNKTTAMQDAFQRCLATLFKVEGSEFEEEGKTQVKGMLLISLTRVRIIPQSKPASDWFYFLQETACAVTAQVSSPHWQL